MEEQREVDVAEMEKIKVAKKVKDRVLKDLNRLKTDVGLLDLPFAG